MKIRNIWALEILDSRGTPTIKTFIELYGGEIGWSSVPSGASTGKYEALELRDKDSKRYQGKGVLKAVLSVNTKIKKAILGHEIINQEQIDKILIELDGTSDKSSLGANTILSVSQAVCKTAAIALKFPLYKYISQVFGLKDKKFLLPIPMFNVLNGGKHAIFSSDIQEYMLIPFSAKTFSESLRQAAEVYYQLKNSIYKTGLATTVGDEGGFAPSLSSNEEPLKLLIEAINKAGYMPGRDIVLALDCAASELYKNGKYVLQKEKKVLSSNQLISIYENWISKYPITSIEDCFDQDDWESYEKFNKKTGKKIQIVGDDLYVTNKNRIERGIKTKATNAVLIKPNQIGTVTETLEAIRLAQENNFKTIISHRSGETEDNFISDLAVGTNAGQIKTGSVCRSERTVKYNRLLEIEMELGEQADFARIF